METNTSINKSGFRKAASIAGGAAALFGLLAIIGWLSGFSVLTGVVSFYLPMAPSTALVSVISGTGMFFLAKRPGKKNVRNVLVPAISLSSLLGLYVSLNFFGVDSIRFEDILSRMLAPNSGSVGHMSPYSGLLFFLYGMVILMNLFLSDRKYVLQVTSIVGFVIGFAGYIALLGYLFSTPYLYGGQMMPLALPTSLVFILLGIGLNLISVPEGFFVRRLVGASTSAQVLRVILPVVIAMIIVEDLMGVYLADTLGLNTALLLSLLTIAFSVLVTFMVMHLTRKIFKRTEQAELEIQLQKKRFQQLFENSPIGKAMLDLEEKILDVNSSFENMFQFTLGEIQGKEINEIIVPREKRAEAVSLREAAIEGNRSEFETTRMRKDGTLVPVQIFVFPIVFDEQQQGLFAIYIDISERKQAEKKIGDQMEELRSWHEATLNREDRVMELKREVNGLLAEIGQPPRYRSVQSEGMDHTG